MPIRPERELRRVDEQEFHDLDYLVTGLAFQVHRELGPWFLNESVYRDELARHCNANQLTAQTGFRVVVTFETFSKQHFLDLVVNDCVAYELKTVETIHAKHRNQTLNYLMLTDLAHAKILNMRAPSVEYEFVSTSITKRDRFAFTLDTKQWRDVDAESHWLREMIINLTKEWGLFLDVALFYDAIIHFRGGRYRVLQPVEVRQANRVIGQQTAHLLTPQSAFKITALSKEVDHFECHLRKFLAITSLHTIQWINFNRSKVQFKTITMHVDS